MIMVKNSRITDWLMSRILTLASASTLEMPAMMPTRSEPIMVMMARPEGALAASLLVLGMAWGMADDSRLSDVRRTYSHPGGAREPDFSEPAGAVPGCRPRYFAS